MALSGPPRAANESLNFSLFLFSCAGSWLLHAGLLWLQQAGPALCRGAQASHCGGFSCCGARALEPGLSRCSCLVACGIFPEQGSDPRPLHWEADSLPLDHQGTPNKSSLTEGCSGFLRTQSRYSVHIFPFSPDFLF